MPARLAFLWHHVAFPAAWISAISAALGVVTADGLAAAITVVGLALSVSLVKLAKPIGDALREILFAWADYRGRIAEIDIKVAANAELIARNKRELDAARAEADQLRAKTVKDEEYNSMRRHELANAVERANAKIGLMGFDLEEARIKIATLKAKLGTIDETHSTAINSVADSTEMIATRLDPPLDVHPPHVEPLQPDPNGDHARPNRRPGE